MTEQLSMAVSLNNRWILYTDGELELKDGVVYVSGQFYLLTYFNVENQERVGPHTVRVKNKILYHDIMEGPTVTEVTNDYTFSVAGVFSIIHNGITSPSVIANFEKTLAEIADRMGSPSIVTATEADVQRLNKQGNTIQHNFRK